MEQKLRIVKTAENKEITLEISKSTNTIEHNYLTSHLKDVSASVLSAAANRLFSTKLMIPASFFLPYKTVVFPLFLAP